MAINYKNINGDSVNVNSVTFNGQAVQQLKYGKFADSVDTVWCKPYTLTIERNVGIRQVKVTRIDSEEHTAPFEELNSGDVVYYGDTLSCEITPMPGFKQPLEPTIHRVTGNTNTAQFLSVEPKEYTLSITYGNGVQSVTVTRQSSPYKGAATGDLPHSAIVYNGDIIYVTATPSEGYELNNYRGAYSVNGDISENITAQLKYFTLCYAAGTGVSQASFTRLSSPYGGLSLGYLSNGALLCYGDTIEASAVTAAGYEVTSLPRYTVDRNINTTISATLKTFKLTIAQRTGVSFVKVKRVSSQNSTATIGELSSGDTLYYGDTIEVDAEPQTGYQLDKDYKYRTAVYEDIVINPLATRKTYKLTKNTNVGVASVIVTKTFNGATGQPCSISLNNGDTISYGDVLSVSATPKAGYSLNDYTKSITVMSGITVGPTANLIPYKLSMSFDNNIASVIVNRRSTAKSGASTGALANNADIYYGDVLVISVTAKSGYKLSTLIVNGASRTNGSSLTVSGAVSVSATSAVKDKAPVLKAISGTNTYTASNKSFEMRGMVENNNNFAVTAVMYINGSIYSTRYIDANGYTTFQSYEDNTTYTTATLRVVFNNSSEMTSSITITPSDFHPQISAGRS